MGAASFLIEGENTDNALTLSELQNNISLRPRTLESVVWSPPDWLVASLAGPEQQTPDIAAIISAIVGRLGWSSGNSLAILITGTGTRTAEVFDDNPLETAILHLEYDQP